MNWDAVGAIAEFTGAIAVIVTLIYLAYQLRLSNQIAKAESIREVTSTYDMLLSHIQQPEISEILRRGLSNFHALSADEKAMFNGYYYPLFTQVETVYEMWNMNLVPDHQYTTWIASAVSVVCTPGGQQWWLHAQKTLSPVFTKAVNELLNDEFYPKVPFTEIWPWMAKE